MRTHVTTRLTAHELCVKHSDQRPAPVPLFRIGSYIPAAEEQRSLSQCRTESDEAWSTEPVFQKAATTVQHLFLHFAPTAHDQLGEKMGATGRARE
jgi:hypothetical protein